ncbi:MAG: phage tail protein, partial [Proteobacteria bacterium]|nr:phage tail protein [Pseudomonadota bacterium]
MRIGEYFLGESPRGVIDTIYREFGMTALQMAQRFGEDQLSKTVKAMLDKNKHSLVDVVHAVEPNFRPLEGLEPRVGDHKFRSVYYEPGSDKTNALLKQEGFDVFPAMAPRFNVNSTDAYGYGPGHIGLGDVKSLQHHELMREEGIEQSVRPAMKAPASLRRSRVMTTPNSITYYDDTARPDSISPLRDHRYELQFSQVPIDNKEAAIDENFFVDLFKMISNLDRREITAREIDERREEKLFLLSPVVENNNDEFLDPLVDISFSEMVRTRQVPDPPPEIEGLPLKVEYVSILADAMKLV